MIKAIVLAAALVFVATTADAKAPPKAAQPAARCAIVHLVASKAFSQGNMNQQAHVAEKNSTIFHNKAVAKGFDSVASEDWVYGVVNSLNKGGINTLIAALEKCKSVR